MLIQSENMDIQQKWQYQIENSSIRQKVKTYIGLLYFYLKKVNTKHNSV